ncbi:radical SAM protein [Candidatus Wolfebacteria bacterium]|nr:radical SAM protein [Candidatus Wolfebacteria bacterium]
MVNDEWAQFFKAHNFKVGVSLDGGQESHNLFRKNHGGKGSFDHAMRGIKILRRYGIEPGIIQTLTRANISRVQEDFNFFVNVLGIHAWGTNFYLDLDNINQLMLDQNLTNCQLADFLRKQIDLWLVRNDRTLRIREIENFISGVFNKKTPSCAFSGSCSKYFCLEYDGKIYPCDRSSGKSDLLLGDFSRQSLQDVFNSVSKLNYDKQINNLPSECSICEWLKFCNNGCVMNREGGIGGKYYYCEMRKEIFAYLKEKVGEYNRSLITQTA